MLPPSNTSSSCPPTMLQYATGTWFRRAWEATRSRRTRHFPAWYGDEEMLMISPAPSLTSRGTGPPGTQTSSQTVTPTRVPPTVNSSGSVPRWK